MRIDTCRERQLLMQGERDKCMYDDKEKNCRDTVIFRVLGKLKIGQH